MGLASRGCLVLVLGATAERRKLLFRSNLGLPWIRILMTYEIDLSTKECQETPRGVRALDRSRTACRGTAPKLDRQREQDSDRAMRVRSHPRWAPSARLCGSQLLQDPADVLDAFRAAA